MKGGEWAGSKRYSFCKLGKSPLSIKKINIQDERHEKENYYSNIPNTPHLYGRN